jgi:DNA-nicking Smr family endonuclease
MSKKRNKTTKHNKFDNLSKPQAEFDFHGLGVLYPFEIKKLAKEFIDSCRNRELTKIIFITGKGLHSRNGSPVVKPILKRYLESLSFVEKVYEARRDRGGDGALEVILN